MSDSTDYSAIYEGVWINWSRGRIFGSTITLNRRDGGLLISFIALFVTLVGTAFWRIICFAIHHYLSCEAPRDALYHQHQAILRNSANGASGLWSLGQVLWTWRHYKTHQPFRRILPAIILTTFFLGSFAVAGIFSSKIATSTGTEVLLTSPHCGRQDFSAMNDTELSAVVLPYLTKRQVQAANYAQKCYSNTTNPEDCRVYVKRQLPWTSNRRAGCPFPSKDICKSNQNNLELDTGFIDSNDHLGANGPLDMRVIFRETLKCAPLVSDGYKTNFSVGGGDVEAQVTRFYYGPLLTSSNPVNYTLEQWEFSNMNYSNTRGRGFKEDYNLQ